MQTYIAALPRGPRKPRLREITATSAEEARRQAATYWRVRAGQRHVITVTEKGDLL